MDLTPTRDYTFSLGLRTVGRNDDLIPFGSAANEREEPIARFKRSLAESPLALPTATTNTYTHAVFRQACSQRRPVGTPVRDRKIFRNIDLAAGHCGRRVMSWRHDGTAADT